MDFRLDVIVRTHNRADLLEGALASVLAADATGLDVRVLVVDNASTDGTPAVLQRLVAEHGGRVVALHEPRPGGQFALNTAIASADAPVIAFFDDDERVDRSWLQVIAREFAGHAVDFIAGRCLPLWNDAPPSWLPEGYGGVLGIIDNGPERRSFGPGFGGMLTQGNCAVRRSVFAEAGPYPPELTTAEDRWLYDWLIGHGKAGIYCPDLVVSHIMQPSRLSRDYFRGWAAREGRDRAVCDRLAGRRSAFRELWYWRHLAASARTLGASRFDGKVSGARAFAADLDLRQGWAYFRASRRPG